MKVLKSFTIISAITTLSIGCAKPDFTYKIDNYDLKITLLSESVMEFGAEGGEGVISYFYESVDLEYTRLSPKPIMAKAECSAPWVTNIRSNEDATITFDVEPNGTQAREATIKVSYEDSGFDVAIHQATNK